jgi:hypothetical protein
LYDITAEADFEHFVHLGGERSSPRRYVDDIAT